MNKLKITLCTLLLLQAQTTMFAEGKAPIYGSLKKAILNDHPKKVKHLLNMEDIDLMVIDDNDNNSEIDDIFDIACEAENPEIIKMVYEKRNTTKISLFVNACKNGKLKTVKALVEHLDFNIKIKYKSAGDFPMGIACKYEQKEIVLYLVKELKKLKRSPLTTVLKKGNIDRLIYFVENDIYKLTIKNLISAWRYEQKQVVNYIAEFLEKKDENLLFKLCKKEQNDLIKHLLENKIITLKKTYNKGKHPLDMVCHTRHAQLARLFLPQSPYPLHNAVKRDALQTVRFLVEATGYDIDTRNKQKETALIIALESNKKEIACYLLSQGANSIAIVTPQAIETKQCHICCKLFENIDELGITRCEHAFCLPCILEHIKQKKKSVSCPRCRKALENKVTKYYYYDKTLRKKVKAIVETSKKKKRKKRKNPKIEIAKKISLQSIDAQPTNKVKKKKHKTRTLEHQYQDTELELAKKLSLQKFKKENPQAGNSKESRWKSFGKNLIRTVQSKIRRKRLNPAQERLIESLVNPQVITPEFIRKQQMLEEAIYQNDLQQATQYSLALNYKIDEIEKEELSTEDTMQIIEENPKTYYEELLDLGASEFTILKAIKELNKRELYKQDKELGIRNFQCPLCKQYFEDREPVAITPANHAFHCNCLKKALQRKICDENIEKLEACGIIEFSPREFPSYPHQEAHKQKYLQKLKEEQEKLEQKKLEHSKTTMAEKAKRKSTVNTIKKSMKITANHNCPECKESFRPKEHVYSTRCGHYFHLPCLHKAIEKSGTCTICSHAINTKSSETVQYKKNNM